MHLPELPPECRLIGVDDASLLAAMPVALRLQELERAPLLAVLQAGALLAPMQDWLAANQYPHPVIETVNAASLGQGPCVLAAPTSLLFAPSPDERIALGAMTSQSRVVLVAPGAEVALGHDAEVSAARLADLVGSGGLLDVSYVAPLGPQGRAYLELIEVVHHGVGPGAQQVVPDSLRAALMGKQGDIAVNLAARNRPPRISWATATFLWIQPSMCT